MADPVLIVPYFPGLQPKLMENRINSAFAVLFKTRPWRGLKVQVNLESFSDHWMSKKELYMGESKFLWDVLLELES